MADNPVGEQVIVVVDVKLAETTDHHTVFTAGVFISALSDIFYQSVVAIGGLKGSLSRLCTHYSPLRRVVTGDEAELLPRSTLSFLIAALIAFAQIKSQGESGFPFQTHPQAIMVAVTSLLIYGLASAAEHLISAATGGVDDNAINSVYLIIVRLGRIGSVCILVASLAYLFYF